MGKPKDKSGQYMGKALRQQRQAAKLFKDIDLPDIEKMKLALEAPELILSGEEDRLRDTELENIMTDSRLRDSQMEALRELEERGEEGLTPEDRARFNALRREVAGDEQARQSSILQQMAQRGALDSGSQLAAQLSSNQQSTQRAAEAADRLAAEAASGRRQALQQAAQTAGALRSQDYGEQSAVARAKDEIARFNAGVSARDTEARRQQETSRANIANQQQMFNKQLGQRQFENQMTKAGAQAGALSGAGNLYARQAAMQKPEASKFATGLAGAASGAGVGTQIGGPGWGTAIGAGVGALGGILADGGVKYQDGGFAAPYDNTMGLPEETVMQKNQEAYMRDLARQDALEKENTPESAVLDPIDMSKAPEEKEDKLLTGLSAISKMVAQKPQAASFSGGGDVLPTSYNTAARTSQMQQYQPVAFEDGGYHKMGYEEGGTTEGRLIPGDSYAGDILPDRINSGESVHNLEMQQNLVEMLKELQDRRVDDMADEGLVKPNPEAQEEIIDLMRGDVELEEANLDQNVVEPTGAGIKRLLDLLENK